MMPFLLAEIAHMEKVLPLYVYCVGSHEQKHLIRPNGFPAHQLFLSRSGMGVFRIEGCPDLLLTPGTALLLPADTPHEYYPDPSGDVGWDLGFAAFHGEMSGSLLRQLDKHVLTVLELTDFGRMWQELEALWHLLSLNGDSAYWDSSKRMYGMLLSLLQDQATGRPARSGIYPAEPNGALQTAVKLIHDHFDERLLLANVARSAGYSVQHFHRLFVASFGITPQQYIMQLRMGRSIQLLQDNPGITVDKVAQQVGMDTTYFIRMFKRTYGTTPKQYMKR